MAKTLWSFGHFECNRVKKLEMTIMNVSKGHITGKKSKGHITGNNAEKATDHKTKALHNMQTIMPCNTEHLQYLLWLFWKTVLESKFQDPNFLLILWNYFLQFLM